MDTSYKLYNEQRTELSTCGEWVWVHVHYSLKTTGDYCNVLESGRVFSYDLDEQLFSESRTEKRRLFPVTCVYTKDSQDGVYKRWSLQPHHLVM